jgi:choline dehydrogenase-like flavoprotein
LNIKTNPKFSRSCFETDVCIVGAGPAGLTLARELSILDLRICVLEAGGEKPDPMTADLNAGEVESPHGYLAETLFIGRRRQLGGTANLWRHELHGRRGKFLRCVALEEIDFEQRDWIPLSGWPFTRRDLAPFYVRAHQLCGIGPFGRTADEWGRRSADGSQPWQTGALESIVSQFGKASLFEKEYLAALKNAANVSIFPSSVVLKLKRDELCSDVISSLEVAHADGHRFVVKAKVVVLAAGGLENARILLLNEVTGNGGSSAQHDMIGRCFMDHPSIALGRLKPFSKDIYDRAAFYDQHDVGGVPIMGMLRLRPEVMRREKLLNAYAVLLPCFRNLRSNFPIVTREIMTKAPHFLMRRLFLGIQPSVPGGNSGVPLSLYQRLLEGYFLERRTGWSKLARKSRRLGDIVVRSLVEQSPNPDNRIVLGDLVDRLGQRRLKVHWRWSEFDLHSIQRTQEIFQQEFAAAGIGVFTPMKPSASGRPWAFNSPHHFMGTTRMHVDPRQGVVDANSRVHGFQNLFVTGSSVFPTGGFANPTLTIVALAIKLSDHLRQLLTGMNAPLPDPSTSSATLRVCLKNHE